MAVQKRPDAHVIWEITFKVDFEAGRKLQVPVQNGELFFPNFELYTSYTIDRIVILYKTLNSL